MKVVAEDVGGGGRNEGGGGVGVEEVVLPLLFFAHAGLDTALAGTSKADLKRTWLLQCSAALSSQGKMLAVAREHWLLILYPSKTGSGAAPAYKDDEYEDEEDEEVEEAPPKPNFSFIEVDAQCLTENGQKETIACLEFVSLVQGSEGGLRQSLAVGYSSGRIRFFTEDGSLLMTQQLHIASVRRIRLRAGASMYGHSLIGEQNEDLSIVYEDGVVATIDGLSLYSALRTCFLYADRKSRGVEVAASTLDYGKWELVGTEEIHDVATCGLVAPSLSTALSSADSLAGDDGSPLHHHHQSAAAGRSRQLLVVGKHPMVAFYLVEEQFLSFTTAVSLASTVATKLTSAVFSLARNWWGGGAPKEEEVEPPKQTETPVTLSFNSYLSDSKRQVGGIALDPMGRYAALTDNLGRVILLDVPHRQMLRMWKGYRDAQCAWLWAEPPPASLRNSSPRSASPRSVAQGATSLNSSSPVSRTHAGLSPNTTGPKQGEGTLPLYLVIYAPRRGILEVWHMRHGSRVGILDVGVDGRLLAPTCPLGTSSVSGTNA